MKTRKTNQFIVHELKNEKDLASCLQLDHTYMTDHVWQMDVREESEGIVVRFRTARLPREIQVAYPRDLQSLMASWHRRDCFLVATADDVLLGYINMKMDAIRTTGWIYDLVVGKPFRGRRIGSALLEQAARWARLHNIHHIILETQTKNMPGINFAQKQGFTFCGFNDRYYANQDIALFFSKTL
jgi:GNAT superfamily N-acetyltransferase